MIPTAKYVLLAVLMGAAIATATAAPEPELARLVNAYRRAPGPCEGMGMQPVPRLGIEPALARVQIRPGTILVAALDAAGYEAEKVDAIQVSGPTDVSRAFAVLLGPHCRTLLHSGYTAIGTQRHGDTWTVVLARPMPDLTTVLPDWQEAGRAILAATNRARAEARMCGNVAFAAAPPLRWNASLALAARAHSEDMARHRTFSHRGSDDSDVGTRTRRAGYRWRSVGENISFGQTSAVEAVDGWLDSPGHCANLMHPTMTEMGAAVALRSRPRQAAYWTQVFGQP